jgi:transposase
MHGHGWYHRHPQDLPCIGENTRLHLTVRNFAKSIRSEYIFIRAALEHEWSNGQTEGQVNRLKFIKRQMYGRASFELLRQKVLYYPGST